MTAVDAKTYSEATPAIVVRRGPGSYQMAHLGDLRWLAAHTEERQYMNLGPGPLMTPKRKVAVPDTVRVVLPLGGTIVATIVASRADRLPEVVRRPTSRALARVEAAEAALKAARAELKAAQRAAFAYGKPIPLSTVKAADRERRKAVGS